MKIPVAAVRKMKRSFVNHEHLWRIMDSAGLKVRKGSAEKMWRGDFEGVTLKETESLLLCLGYRIRVEQIKGMIA